MKYLLKKENDYYFGVLVKNKRKLPKYSESFFVDSLIGHELASSVVVEFDEFESPIYWTEDHETGGRIEQERKDGVGYAKLIQRLTTSLEVHQYSVDYGLIVGTALKQLKALPDATVNELFDAVVDALKPQENNKKNKAAK